MEKMSDKSMESNYFKYVLWLAIFTIVYNIAEGLASMWLGAEEETLALFGFGVDSFIEVVSGLGILQMVLRIWKHPQQERGHFEVKALRITGIGFYVLAIGLALGAGVNLYQRHKPETTLGGILISILSILAMVWLYKTKTAFGRKLNSEPILADGRCTLVCIYMSIILLVSSVIFELSGIGWIDAIGSLGLAWFSFTEGKEAFEKAKGKAYSCCHT